MYVVRECEEREAANEQAILSLIEGDLDNGFGPDVGWEIFRNHKKRRIEITIYVNGKPIGPLLFPLHCVRERQLLDVLEYCMAEYENEIYNLRARRREQGGVK